jgi:basic membrane protein A
MSSDFLGFIFPKGSDIVPLVDGAIEELAQNGFLNEINAKYFGPDFSVTYDDLFPPEPFLACQVTDVGGIDDKSFNATAWKGMEDAVADFGIEAKYLESQQQTDYEANINAFLEEGCDLIVSVGFLLGDATAAAAGANPDQNFGIVDVNYLDFPNLYGSGFAINESTFLAGYLAAGMTETGTVATYGGINIPPVTIFMDGFVLGVDYYNEVHGTSVQTLGWDVAAQDGLFAGNFESTDDGRTLGESLLDEGADIIMPVAGPVGSGTLAVLEERGTGMIVGVDNDWSVAYANQAGIVLASAMKNMDKYVYETIASVQDGTFAGGNYLGTLENGGVGLTYGGVDVPADLKAEVDALVPLIIAGDIATLPVVEEVEPVALPDLGGREVTVAVENAYLPYNYIDPDSGEPAGWDYDVWNEICDLLNCKAVFVEASWEGMIQAVSDGQYDAAGDGITITPDRAELVDFSMGYMAIEQRLLVRVGEDRFESIEDIVADETLKLGTQTGTTNYETALTYLPAERIQAFEQFPFAVQALIAGDIDAVMIDETAGLGYMGENADKVVIIGPSMSSDMLGFIYPKGSDLVDPVDLAITELWANGTMDEINAFYFSPEFPITYEMLD